MGRYLPIMPSMRRKPGALLPIEEAILAAGLDLRRMGTREFHGFAVAKRMQDIGEAHQLTAHGTLYKALGRMEAAGLLESRWEKADLALEEGRPRRRLYRLTGAGERVVAAHRAESGRAVRGPRKGLAPS
jgi:DNA-binding PadR family transcriptional regulator